MDPLTTQDLVHLAFRVFCLVIAYGFVRTVRKALR